MVDSNYFSNLNSFNLVTKITAFDNCDIPGLGFAEHLELVPSKPTQPNTYFCFLSEDCTGYLNVIHQASSKLKYYLRCTVCKKKISPTNGTCFEKSRITIIEFYEVLFKWCLNEGNKNTIEETNLNKNTIVEYFQFFREVALGALSEFDSSIGGEGRHVEIDESLLFRRKYNRGRLLDCEKKQIWVVGGVERESGRCFIEIVPNRTMITLTEVIERNVKKGTTILTDQWRGYNNLERLGYLHSSVNHSINFINPLDESVHTQTVERLWKSLKESIPKEANGPKKSEYMIEYMFRRRYFYGKSVGNRFKLMLEFVAKQYRSQLFIFKNNHN